MTAPDVDLTAALAGITQRHREAHYAMAMDGPNPLGSAMASVADIPPLVAALEVALSFHVEAVIEDMPDPFHYCKTCSGHPAWPCPEVAAITRELNGENSG